jgi:hypothetical protein
LRSASEAVRALLIASKASEEGNASAECVERLADERGLRKEEDYYF